MNATIDSDTFFVRALTFSPLVWLGRVSYSVYVWQQFIHANYGVRGNLLVDCVVAAIAVASYYMIEKPLTSFGKKVANSWKGASVTKLGVAGG